MADFDLAIIGGGINGVGIARDAAGRGLKVLLVEQNDLGSGTSSASSKLIHGGLRYLARGAFRLVRESLAERETLLRLAPHLVRPIRFVMPADGGQRSPTMLRLGLFIYDHLGRRKVLPASRSLDLTDHTFGYPLRRRYRLGFEYSDCSVDDARLVVVNARDAADRGATIMPRTRCVRAERGADWTLVLNAGGKREVVTAQALVNAAGPWLGAVAENVIRRPAPARVRLSKGSHIVIKRPFEHEAAYIFPTDDGRVVFALPFERDFTLIGATDTAFSGDPEMVSATIEDIEYLCKVANSYLREVIVPADVVWAYSGVRALFDDGRRATKDVTRDYVLDLETPYQQAPILTVYGGKLTTYRRLAEAALAKLADRFVTGPSWTADVPLPGGDFDHAQFESQVSDALKRWPFLAPTHARRLISAYGTRINRILGEAKQAADLGRWFGANLTEAEIAYLMRHEWAQTADDVLWRRTKTGLHMNAAERDAVRDFLDAKSGRNAA